MRKIMIIGAGSFGVAQAITSMKDPRIELVTLKDLETETNKSVFSDDVLRIKEDYEQTSKLNNYEEPRSKFFGKSRNNFKKR